MQTMDSLAILTWQTWLSIDKVVKTAFFSLIAINFLLDNERQFWRKKFRTIWRLNLFKIIYFKVKV